MTARGIVLAAGAGSRYGMPKGLARTADGTPWVTLAIRMLRAGGCDDVAVLVGARGAEVADLVGDDARTVRVPDWAAGLAATLRSALAAAEGADAIVITPVDTPAAVPEAVTRVCAASARLSSALVQATYDGVPGHPVLIGSEHFGALADVLEGDRGAGPYLRENAAVTVECGDLWSGADIDVPR